MEDEKEKKDTNRAKIIAVVVLLTFILILGVLVLSGSFKVGKTNTEKTQVSNTKKQESITNSTVVNSHEDGVGSEEEPTSKSVKESTDKEGVQKSKKETLDLTSNKEDLIVLKEGEWQRVDLTPQSYNSDNLLATGKIAQKNCYVNTENQVIYELVFDIGFGSATQEVKHYCSYTTFSKVEVGDNVKVTFNTLKDIPSVFSISDIEISK